MKALIAVLLLSAISLSSCQDSCLHAPVLGCDLTLPVLELIYQKTTVTTCDSDYVSGKTLYRPAPAVKFAEADPNGFYTLIMIDPDAPKHAAGEAWLHWIVAHIPGEDMRVGNLAKGKIVAEYKHPTPPSGSGTHRYLTYVYEESSETNPDPPAVEQRKKFRIEEYAAGLAMCGPVASNMFLTRF